MPIECVERGWSGGLGDAPECRTKSREEVAPDGAEVGGLEHRAKVRDKGAGAVVCLECSCDRSEGGGCGVGDSNAGEWGVGEGCRDGILCKAPEEGAAYVVGEAIVGGGRRAAENAGKSRGGMHPGGGGPGIGPGLNDLHGFVLSHPFHEVERLGEVKGSISVEVDL